MVTRLWMRSLHLEAHPALLQTTPSNSFYQEANRGGTLNSREAHVPAGRAGEEDRAPWLGIKGSRRTKEKKESTKIRWENKLMDLSKEPQAPSTQLYGFGRRGLVKMEVRPPCVLSLHGPSRRKEQSCSAAKWSPTEHCIAGKSWNKHRMSWVNPLTKRLLPFHTFFPQAMYLSLSVPLWRSQRLPFRVEMVRELKNAV